MPDTTTWLNIIFGIVDAGVKYAIEYQPKPKPPKPLTYEDLMRSVEVYFPEMNTTTEPPEEVMVTKAEQRTPLGSNLSFKGQTADDYCLECLTRHYSKAYGLLDEGKRFALKEGKITPEARERIRQAITEIVTAEEDLGTKVSDPELKKMLDEINVKQRELRKWMWSNRLPTTNEDLNALEEAINKSKELVDTTYKVAEMKLKKEPGECTTCEEKREKLVEMLKKIEDTARSKRLQLMGENAVPQSS